MIGIGAGMAVDGMVPFCASFTPFATRRVYDAVTISVAYADANVKIVGTAPGITTGPNGGTHMCFQDLAIEYQETPPGTLHHFSLNDLRLDDIADKGPINIQGSGSFEGESFKITGTLPAIQDVLDVDRPKPVALDITGNNGHVNIAGTIIDFVHGKGLELRLDIATPATRLVLEWLGDDIPEVGDLHASALLRKKR